MHDLAIRNLSHTYGKKTVLEDISFKVNPGELVCLLGPSGCGKSTLLRLIAGFEKTQSGSILCGGNVLSSPQEWVAPEKRHIGLVLQQPCLFPHLSVRNNIQFGIKHLPSAEREKITQDLLKHIKLNDSAGAYPHMLSGGQQQRVSLARGLATQPKIMLLDEPFANLDHELRLRLREDLVNLLHHLNTTTIMVTHNPEEALLLADRIILLRPNGTIHQIGTPDEVHDHPVDIEAARFFGPLNVFEGKVEKGVISTPIGALEQALIAPQAQEGQTVHIAVRPEGMRVDPTQKSNLTAQVQEIRHTTTGRMVTARFPSGQFTHFHEFYTTQLSVGQKVHLQCQFPHVFGFVQP